MPRTILLCTVGTSLFTPNLAGLRRTLAEDGAKPDDKKAVRPAIRPAAEQLATAFEAQDWTAVARHLCELPPTERLCGAEVNSVAALVAGGLATAGAGVFLFHSDTHDGSAIASVLAAYFRALGHSPVEAVRVPDLQDADPARFEGAGLPNLARAIAAVARERGPSSCAVNATGGFKAQTATAVLAGQALGVPAYYLHERFGTPIRLPVITAEGLAR